MKITDEWRDAPVDNVNYQNYKNLHIKISQTSIINIHFQQKSRIMQSLY